MFGPNLQRIRSDFPVLSRCTYFDNACMTLKPRQVIEKMNEYYSEYTACSGRSAHRLADRTGTEMELARAAIARQIGAKRDEVVFQRNTTEGINLVAGSLEFSKGDEILTTDIEHNSNLLPWQKAAAISGATHRVIPTNSEFQPDFDFLASELKKGRVKLVALPLVSNISGTRMPAEKISRLAHSAGALVLVDGAQGVPSSRTSVSSLGCDFLCFSGHKMCGPTGTGILWGRKKLLEELPPFLVGGETVANSTYSSADYEKPPAKFEAGLQDYAGIIGLGAASNYLQKLGFGFIEGRKRKLVKVLVEGLRKIPQVRLISPERPAEYSSALANFSVEGLDHHQVAITLDEVGKIALRSGRHCVHSWYNSRKISGSVRPSLYFYNTEGEVEFFLKTLSRIVSDLSPA
ncbi:MAG: cysteine desulfurase [archaeon]